MSYQDILRLSRGFEVIRSGGHGSGTLPGHRRCCSRSRSLQTPWLGPCKPGKVSLAGKYTQLTKHEACVMCPMPSDWNERQHLKFRTDWLILDMSARSFTNCPQSFLLGQRTGSQYGLVGKSLIPAALILQDSCCNGC